MQLYAFPTEAQLLPVHMARVELIDLSFLLLATARKFRTPTAEQRQLLHGVRVQQVPHGRSSQPQHGESCSPSTLSCCYDCGCGCKTRCGCGCGWHDYGAQPRTCGARLAQRAAGDVDLSQQARGKVSCHCGAPSGRCATETRCLLAYRFSVAVWVFLQSATG